MKWIKKYRYELLAGVLGTAFATMLLYLIIIKPEDLMVRGTVMFGLFFDAIASPTLNSGPSCALIGFGLVSLLSLSQDVRSYKGQRVEGREKSFSMA